MFACWPTHRAPHQDDASTPAPHPSPAPPRPHRLPSPAHRYPARVCSLRPLPTSHAFATRAQPTFLLNAPRLHPCRLPNPLRTLAARRSPTSQCPARRLTPRRRFRSLRLASAASHLSPTCLSNSFRSVPARVDCPTRPATFQPRPTSHLSSDLAHAPHLTSTPLAIPRLSRPRRHPIPSRRPPHPHRPPSPAHSATAPALTDYPSHFAAPRAFP